MSAAESAATIEVVDLTEDDLPRVAVLHIEAFPDSELAKLGAEAVRRQYLWQMRGPHDLTALGVRRDGELVGYLMGGVFRGSTIGFLLEEKWFLVRMVVRHPGVIIRENGRRVLSTAAGLIFRRKQSLDTALARPARVSFGVQAVTVLPSAQRLGLGAVLMAAAEERARAEGYETMHLNVHPDNKRALAFYESLGWRRLYAPSDNESHWRLGKDLRDPEAASADSEQEPEPEITEPEVTEPEVTEPEITQQ